MTQPESFTAFTGDIPANYDRHLGPVIFEPHAVDLAGRLPAWPTIRVLETACGTGIVTRRILERLPAGGTLTATDLNESMLAYAQTRVGSDPRLTWRTADAQALPFADASFDVIICQFGVMFYPDKARALAEAKRVLAPGAMLIFNTWDRLEANPFSLISHEVVTAAFPTDPPQFYHVPFSMHDPEAIRSLVTRAGFRDVAIENREVEVESKSAHSHATGLLRGTPAAHGVAERGGDPKGLIEAIAKRAAGRFGDAPSRFPTRAWVITARA